MVELGTAGLADRIGKEILAPNPPSAWLPSEVTVAGQVLPLARERSTGDAAPFSSFRILATEVSAGAIVLIQADPAVGAAFGSNLALHAAVCGAQALVTDGRWRDGGRLRWLGLPIAGNGSGAARAEGFPYVRCESLQMFGLRWASGDWLLRDADAVMRLDGISASAIADEIAREFRKELAGLVEHR
jgi:regulator of RNase E activity RraA